MKGKGVNLGMPALPLTAPITAQIANLDGGDCWETPFATAKVNVAGKVVAGQ